jgi:hypothetical protein
LFELSEGTEEQDVTITKEDVLEKINKRYSTYIDKEKNAA